MNYNKRKRTVLGTNREGKQLKVKVVSTPYKKHKSNTNKMNDQSTQKHTIKVQKIAMEQQYNHKVQEQLTMILLKKQIHK